MRSLARLIPGIGGLLAVWLFLPRALVDRGPYLQIVGHYSGGGTTPVAIGSGPNTDLRLTETGVAPLHGWLIRSTHGALTYVQASTSRGSQRIRAGAFPGKPWNSFERVANADTVRVYDNGRLARTDVITFLDARVVELSSADGETRTTLLPEADRQGVPLADRDGVIRSWLMRCGGRIGFAPAQSCAKKTFAPLSLLGRAAFWWRAPARVPQSNIPQWLGGGWIRNGPTIENAFARFNDGPPRYIPEINSSLDPVSDAGYVLYRTGRSDPRPRIARSSSFEKSVVLEHGTVEQRVGETEVAAGDVLSLGDTYFVVDASATGQIALRPVEKHDRFHFFYSLSAGRFNFATRVQRVPLDAKQPLAIEGISGAGSATGLPPASTSPAEAERSATMWRLPVAARFGVASGAAPGTAMRLRIADAHAVGKKAGASASFVNVVHGRGSGDLAPISNSLKHGTRTPFAGHLVAFYGMTPPYEQLVPPLVLCAALMFLGYVAAGAILAVTAAPLMGRGVRMLSRAFALVALACIFFLIVTGTLIMAHMAAHDLLIGKADYYHRQLFYLFLTAALITAIVAAIRPGQDNRLDVPAWMGFPLSLRVLIGSAALLLLWQLADFLAFRLVAPAAVPTGPIKVQLISAVALTLLFVLTGIAAVSPEQSRRWTMIRWIIAIVAAAVIVAASFYGLKTSALLAGGVVAFWGVVYGIGRQPPPRRLADIRAEAASRSRWSNLRLRIRDGRRRIRERWGVLAARHRMLIGIGIVILASGAFMGSGRDGVGVKPAEFAVWFLAPGICALLALDFRRRESNGAQTTGRRLTPPGWLIGLVAPIAPAWRKFRSFCSEWRWLLRFAAMLAVLLFLLLLYRSLVSPALIVSAFVPIFALLVLVRWTERPPGENADVHWSESLRRSVRLYVPVLLTILTIELVVNVFYAGYGDFGPLLVLVPSIAFLTVIWALSPDYSEMATTDAPAEGSTSTAEAQPDGPPEDAAHEQPQEAAQVPAQQQPPPPRHIGLRLSVAGIFLLTCLWGGVVAWNLVQSPIAAEIAGTSATRATKRFLTRSAPWFTKEGSWSTDSLWIANGYYDRERMLANLHSDLVFVALVQAFGVRDAIVVLGVFGLLVALSFASLGVKMSRWSGSHPNPTVRLQTRRTTLLLYFAGIYVAVELIVHVGSSLNAMWQTGVTLPWISSGGSASLGFGGLCAIALALAMTSLTTAETSEQENAE